MINSKNNKSKLNYIYQILNKKIVKHSAIFGFFLSIFYILLFKNIVASTGEIAIIIYIILNTAIFWGLGLRMRQLVKFTNIDYQTGLYNRKYLEEELKILLSKVEKTCDPLSLCVVDIDDFKKINDTFGHLKGDELILKTSNLLATVFRKEDIVCRWGGDEFVAVMPKTDEIEGVSILENLIKTSSLVDESTSMSLSAGLVTTYKKYDLNRLLRKADLALYKAKEEKNTVFLGEVIK